MSEVVMTGIDVSHYNGKVIDWDKVRKSGKRFAIIKAGGSEGGFYKESTFETHYAGAKAAGMYVGAYFVVGKGCDTTEDGIADARRFLEHIKGKQFEMPVVLDWETTSIEQKKGATDAAIGFCKTMEEAGYYVSIYGSDDSTFKERLEADRLTKYDKWVARYAGKPKYIQIYGMWQYTSKGIIDGITGYVDLNEAYKDYPSIMNARKLNGFNGKEEVAPVQPQIQSKKEYKLQCGSFLIYKNAQNLVDKIKKYDQSVLIEKVGLQNRVVLPEFVNKKTAEQLGECFVARGIIKSYIVKEM